MQDIGRSFALFGFVFLLLLLLYNLLMPRLPRIPGDIDINKSYLKVYIPFTSAIVLSVILTLIFNFFRK